MILLENGACYAPEPLGKKDVLLAGTKIVAIADKITPPTSWEVDVVSCGGKRVVPGLIDGHTHLTGGGGEGGPATRTPELQLSHFLEAGVTSAVGCLGTDGITRTVDSLLMKAKSLKQEGLSSWIYTGSYQVPPPTLCGDVTKDLCYVDEIIGAGEIAIADRRSSSPTVQELIKLAKQVRLGGMFGGKAGIVHMHMGDEPEPFSILEAVVAGSELQFADFFPTHINRNHHIFEDAKTYGKKGPMDITTGAYPYFPDEEVKPSQGVIELLNAGVPLEHITLSSDAGGSLPEFDDQGNLAKLSVGYPSSLLREISDGVSEGLAFEKILATVTANPARILKLPGKGNLRVGADADLLVLDEDYRVHHLFAQGKPMVRDGQLLHRGTFE